MPDPATHGRDDEFVTKTSPRTVDDTVDRLRELLDARALQVFAVISHSDAARAAGLQLRDTIVVLFGSPVAGTPVMEAAPVAAIDLPLKVLVWADGERTNVTYTNPAALAARHGLSDELSERLAGIGPLTDTLVAP